MSSGYYTERLRFCVDALRSRGYTPVAPLEDETYSIDYCHDSLVIGKVSQQQGYSTLLFNVKHSRNPFSLKIIFHASHRLIISFQGNDWESHKVSGTLSPRMIDLFRNQQSKGYIPTPYQDGLVQDVADVLKLLWHRENPEQLQHIGE